MKTVEVQQTDSKKNERLIRNIAKKLNGHYYHFLYEPKLIIRADGGIPIIRNYLTKRGIRHKIYSYPFPKGKGYGEEKKSVVYRYRDEFIPLMQIQGKLSLKTTKKDRSRIIERYSHTFLNSLGMDDFDEPMVLLWLASGRIGVIERYHDYTPTKSLFCKVIIWMIKVQIKLLKLMR